MKNKSKIPIVDSVKNKHCAFSGLLLHPKLVTSQANFKSYNHVFRNS